MRRYHMLFASIALLAFAAIPTSANAQGAWKGAAISDTNKVYFAWGDNESDALDNALRKCRSVASRCQDDPAKSISVETWWWLVILDCNGRKFAGGSQWNGDVAIDNAKGKAPARLRESCFLDQQLAGTTPTYNGQGDTSPRR
jgi:hypothetical protein